MTRDEARKFIEYANTIYPSARMTDEQIIKTSSMWFMEFQSVPLEKVSEAFHMAQIESPNWLPSIPMVNNQLMRISSSTRQKSDEQEFRDSHCGKSRQEWEAMTSWEQSEEGKRMIDSFRQKINALILK